MIKKKSLAVVSTGLLVAGSFAAAAPAQAAGELKLEALSGVGYSVPHTSEFELKTSVTAGNDSDELVALKYKIVTGGNVNVLGDSGDATLAAGAANLVQDVENDAVYADDAYAAGDTVNVLAIKIQTAADAAYALDASNVSVTVTAFVDKDGDDVVDGDEWQASQTVTWVDSDNISATTVLSQPAIGDETVEATVSVDGINLAQSSNIWFVDFTEDDDSDGAADATADNETGTYDSDDNVLEFATTASDAVAAGNKVPDNGGDGNGTNAKVAAGIYGAQAQFTGDVDNGAKSTRTVSAADIDAIAFAAAAGADNEVLAGNDVDARSGSGSLKVKYTATNGGNAVEDEVLTLVVQENGIASLDSDASVTVNGLTLTNTSDATKQKITTTGTSDADGEVEFVISWSGTVKTDKLDLIISADGVSVTDTITFEDAAPEAVYSSDVTGTTKSEIYVGKDTAFSLYYSVTDQFGGLFTGTGHTIQVSDTAITRSGVVSNGTAKVDFAGYAANGAKTMTATLYKGNAIAQNQAAANITRALELTVGAPKDVAAITITETDTFGSATALQPLMLKDWNDADVRIGGAAPTVASGITATITLSDANGNATQNSVTLSGSNLYFSDDVAANAELYTTGSITLKTNASGQVAVEIYSNTAGEQTLTVTSGGVTKTDSLFFAAAANDTGTVLTLDMPEYAKAGSSFTVTGTLTDKYGNPVEMANDEDTDANEAGDADDDGKVDFKITYSGAGLTVGTLPTSTDSAGTFKFNVLLGSNDSGTGTVTVSYEAEDDPQDTTAAVVVAKSFTVGEAPVAQKVNAGSFKGYVAVYARGYEGQRLSAKIGNDWVIVDPIVNNQENGTLHRTVDFTGAGVDIAVRIYIDRVLVDTINLTTK